MGFLLVFFFFSLDRAQVGQFFLHKGPDSFANHIVSVMTTQLLLKVKVTMDDTHSSGHSCGA